MFQSHSPPAKIEKRSKIFGKKLSDDGGNNGCQSPTSPFKDEFSIEVKSSILEHGLKFVKKSEQTGCKIESSKSQKKASVRTPSPTGFQKKPFSSFMTKLQNSTLDLESLKNENRSISSSGTKSPEESQRSCSFVLSEDSNSFICTQNPSNLRGRSIRTSFSSSKKSTSPVSDTTMDTSVDFSSISDNANDSSDFRKGLYSEPKSTNRNVSSFKLISQEAESRAKHEKLATQKATSFNLVSQKEDGENSQPRNEAACVIPLSMRKPSTAKASTPEKPSRESVATPKRRRKRLRSCDMQDEDTTTQEISVSWRPDSVSIRQHCELSLSLPTIQLFM